MPAENVFYIHDKLLHDLFDLLQELIQFASDNYGEVLNEQIGNITDKMDVSEGLAEKTFFQVAWWAVICSPLAGEDKTIFQLFLAKKRHVLRKKSNLFQQVVASWLSSSPGFYYVDDDKSSSGRVFVVSDIFECRPRIVCMYNDIYQMPESGEVITGMLLPIGDGSYITPAGFFHIPEHLSQTVFQEILPLYEKNLKSPNYEFNLYPKLLMISAQTIDRQGLKV
ncbi:hypothetical protein [Virgibacillus sp. JSM 102003]|uniref:hypothetical protein n=1 Tax=Virgibacillus sp. JSM 102003 TaxID=1562108 RepID=UPI0035BEC110